MQPLKWNRKNEVFVPELDAEHRNVFRLIEELRTALAAGATEHAQALLNELIADTEEHFRHEERLMREARYPSFDWHKRQHETVRKRVSEYEQRNQAGDADALRDLLDFLSNWLQDHTGLTDRMMCAFVRNYRRAHPTRVS